MAYFSANGHMFSLLNKAGELGIRFSKEVQKGSLAKFGTTPLRSHGSERRGYVLIPEKLFKTPKKVTALLDEAYDYVMSLEPK
jgi:hypothetical protein